MMFWRKLGMSDGAVAALVALLAIMAASVWAVWNGQSRENVRELATIAAPDVASDAVARVEDAAQPEPIAPVSELSAEVPEVEDAGETATETAKIPVPTAPALDLVRVSPEGDAVIAGTADPDAKIVFLVNGEELARTTTDASGSFVGLFSIPASDQPNAITVAVEDSDGGLISDESILVAAIATRQPTANPATVESAPEVVTDTQVAEPVTNEAESDIAVASIAPPVVQPKVEPAQDVAKTEPAIEPEADRVATAPVFEVPVDVQDDVAAIEAEVDAIKPAQLEAAKPVAAEQAPKREAPAIVVAGSDGVKLLQPAQQPDAPKLEATSNVVIDTITYDAEGEVALVGRGSGEGFVRVYLNDKPILTVPVEKDGSWATPLADVDAGVYQLRIDEISNDGTVTSRVETPFQREEVELAADAPPTAITVQTGSTLWAIARDRFGDGIEYVRVYNANRDLIRDPDLIYPGQVFALPAE